MSVQDLRSRYRRVREVTELSRVKRQGARLDELEVAVRENALLAEQLDRVVDDIEQAVVPALERLQDDAGPA